MRTIVDFDFEYGGLISDYSGEPGYRSDGWYDIIVGQGISEQAAALDAVNRAYDSGLEFSDHVDREIDREIRRMDARTLDDPSVGVEEYRDELKERYIGSWIQPRFWIEVGFKVKVG